MTEQVSRRHALATFGGIGIVAFLAACGSDASDPASPSTTNLNRTDGSDGSDASTGTDGTSGSTKSTGANPSCDAIPPETGGPFPGDGTNGPNVLDQDGVIRRDITSSFGDSSGTAAGLPLEIEFTVTDSGCAPMNGAAVYAWHCDAEGRYSLYSDGATEANYLRGVQIADDAGIVRFTSIYPGCYPGRWPHVHFAVYRDEASAVGGGSPISTSQLAFPREACEAVYSGDGYDGSSASLAQLSLESDSVFADDGGVHQLAQMDGDAASGFTAKLNVAA